MVRITGQRRGLHRTVCGVEVMGSGRQVGMMGGVVPAHYPAVIPDQGVGIFSQRIVVVQVQKIALD